MIIPSINRRGLLAGLSMAILLIALAPSRAFALATATATAAEGNNCGSISIPRREDPGIMSVSKVFKNGVEISDYKVKDGTDNSSRPVIQFDPALTAGDVIKVELTTKNAGTYTVNLKLETKQRGC